DRLLRLLGGPLRRRGYPPGAVQRGPRGPGGRRAHRAEGAGALPGTLTWARRTPRPPTRAAGDSPDRLEHGGREGALFLLPPPDDDAGAFRHLPPRPPQSAARLRGAPPGA